MDRAIRPVTEPEFAAFIDLLETGAGRHLTPEALQDALTAYPLERSLGLFEDDILVGGTSSDRLELTVPGGATPVAVRPTLAAIAPTARKRHHATALLARQLADFADRQEPLVVATTSTPGLITGIGYAPATVSVEVEVELAHIRLRPETDEGRVRMMHEREALVLMPSLFDEHRHGQTGQVARTETFWRMWWQDRELYRIGPGPRFAVVAEDADGVPRGYLTYRLAAGDLRDQPVRDLVVEDLIATTDAARRSLWRFCLEFGQASVVKARNIAIDDPLPWLLRGSRGLRRTRVRDFLWIRIVDVAAVLAARTYSADDRMLIEVRDDLLPANAGTYCLDAGRTAATCAPGAGSADLSIDVADLAAAYLGGTTFHTLARAGRVEELKHGALARASSLFASHPAGWTVTDW